jgi:hypothetical protein
MQKWQHRQRGVGAEPVVCFDRLVLDRPLSERVPIRGRAVPIRSRKRLTLVHRVDYKSQNSEDKGAAVKLRHGSIRNLSKLLSMLEFEFGKDAASGHALVLSVVDFATLSFKQHIKVSTDTDILIGAHGAGLTHTLWLKGGGRAALIEFMTTRGEGQNQHYMYRNLAGLMDVEYCRVMPTSAFTLQESDIDVARLRECILSSLQLIAAAEALSAH